MPYETAVDMGTSVMWASFNIGAEDDETATAENIGGIAGNYFMWGANQTTSSFGSSSYANYNKNFTAGTKPNELPLGYDYSGDAIYDAARNVWGGKWRTPSWEEWQELYNACTYKAETGKLTFFSRTRNVLWTKGETSGHFLQVVKLRADCDRDTVLATVIPHGKSFEYSQGSLH